MNFSLFILEKDKETISLICKLEFFILFSFCSFSNSYQKLNLPPRPGTVLFSTPNWTGCHPHTCDRQAPFYHRDSMRAAKLQ